MTCYNCTQLAALNEKLLTILQGRLTRPPENQMVFHRPRAPARPDKAIFRGRNTTAEIRKKIAQYIRTPGHAISNACQIAHGIHEAPEDVLTHLRGMLKLNNYGRKVENCMKGFRP